MWPVSMDTPNPLHFISTSDLKIHPLTLYPPLTILQTEPLIKGPSGPTFPCVDFPAIDPQSLPLAMLVLLFLSTAMQMNLKPEELFLKNEVFAKREAWFPDQINAGNTGLNQVQRNFSEPLLSNAQCILQARNIRHSVSDTNLTIPKDQCIL